LFGIEIDRATACIRQASGSRSFLDLFDAIGTNPPLGLASINAIAPPGGATLARAAAKLETLNRFMDGSRSQLIRTAPCHDLSDPTGLSCPISSVKTFAGAGGGSAGPGDGTSAANSTASEFPFNPFSHRAVIM